MYFSNPELALGIAKQIENDKIKQVAAARANQAAMLAKMGTAMRWLGTQFVTAGNHMQIRQMKLQRNEG